MLTDYIQMIMVPTVGLYSPGYNQLSW